MTFEEGYVIFHAIPRPAIEAALREIAKIDSADGFEFSWAGIEELRQPHMEYPGYRASLNVKFEKMKDKNSD